MHCIKSLFYECDTLHVFSMNPRLRRFSADKILLTPDETLIVYRFFYGNLVPQNMNITQDDMAFAQALLVRAVDDSNKIGWFEAIWKSTATPSPDFNRVFKKFARNAAIRWFKNAKNKSDITQAKIYVMVKNSIARKFRSCFSGRAQSGLDLICYK